MRSERWALGSSFFRSQGSSYHTVNTATPEQLEDLQKIAIRTRLPVLCWTEKLILLIDYFQIFTIIWNAAQPYPWPYLWTRFSRPLLYVCLDFFSQTVDGALAGQSSNARISDWGEMEGYLNYALIFSAVAVVLALSFYLCLKQPNIYGQDDWKYRSHLLAAVLLCAYVLYLPCSLAVFRIYYCDDDKHVLAVDPSVACWGWLHDIYIIVCTSAIIPLFVGLPVVLFRLARQGIVYQSQTDHEKCLQVWEVLYMLELDSFWLDAQLWISSSFRFFGAYLLCHTTVLKAALLLLFIFFRTHLAFQAALMLLAIGVFASYYTFYKYPFRSLSSNLIFGTCLTMHIVNLSFGLANSAGVQSAVTVGSTEYLTLLVYNLSCYFAIFCILAYIAYFPQDTDWPSVRTLSRIYRDPVLLAKVAHWVETMREAHTVKMAFLLAPSEVADVHGLEECIRLMRACWITAKACGSLFEKPLGDQLEELVYIHASRLPHALRRFDHWDKAYQRSVASKSFSDHRSKHLLMNDRKRRLLLKLLAYRFLQGNKFKGQFSFENVAEYRRMMTQFELEMRQRRRSLLDSSVGGEDRSSPAGDGRRFSFANFSRDASAILRRGASASHLLLDRSASNLSATDPAKREGSGRGPDDGLGASSGRWGDGDQLDREEGGRPKFDEETVEEARRTINRLQTRTEAALNKFHQAKRSLMEQLQASGNTRSSANLMSSSTSSLLGGGGGLVKVSTMELMKHAVDVDEQKDLEDLFHLWDDAIQLYEKEEFPGDYEVLNVEVENWYAYRGLVSQRLELIVEMLQEQEQLIQEIGGQEVIEEGEEEEDPLSPRGRLVSDDDVMNEEEEEEGVRGLVSDDEDEERQDDILSSKFNRKGLMAKRSLSRRLQREEIDDDDDDGHPGRLV